MVTSTLEESGLKKKLTRVEGSLLVVFTLAYVNISIWAWVHVEIFAITVGTAAYMIASFLMILFNRVD